MSALVSALVFGALAPAAQAGAFGVGNIVVLRTHNTAALTSAATAVYLDEYSRASDGALSFVQSIPMSGLSAPNNNFVCSGNSGNDGQLSRSQDRRYIIAAGYTSTLGTTSVGKNVTDQRVVARIDASGAVDTTTLMGSTAFMTGSCRWATSKDGSEFWVGGSNTGVWYTLYGAGNTPVNITTVTGTAGTDYIVNTRAGFAINNQLYVTHQSYPTGGTGHTGIVKYGTGLVTAAASAGVPTDVPSIPVTASTGGSNVTGFAGVAVQSPSSMPDTFYVANGNAIEKYCFNGTTWALVGSVASTNQTYGVIAIKSSTSSDVDVYYTVGYTGGNTIKRFRDNTGWQGAMGGVTETLCVTAAAAGTDYNAFRGITVTPDTATFADVTSFKATINGSAVNLSWTTQSEKENAGFNVWRADSPEGPFVKVNENLIPALGGLYSGASYAYNDILAPGATAYYRLEDIDTHGVSTYQPVIKLTGTSAHLPAPTPSTPKPPTGPRVPRPVLSR